MDIYIKPEKKIITSKTGKVKIKDIAKVYVEDPSLLKHINNLTVLNIKENENKCYLITVIDIINIKILTIIIEWWLPVKNITLEIPIVGNSISARNTK